MCTTYLRIAGWQFRQFHLNATVIDTMAVIVSIPSWVMPSGRSLNVADPAELWRFCDNLRLLMWCHQWQLPPAWWRRQMLLRQVFFCDKKKQWKNLMGLSSRYVCRKPRKEGHLTYVGRLVDEVTKFPFSGFCPRFRKSPVATISYPITFWMHFKNLPKKKKRNQFWQVQQKKNARLKGRKCKSPYKTTITVKLGPQNCQSMAKPRPIFILIL